MFDTHTNNRKLVVRTQKPDVMSTRLVSLTSVILQLNVHIKEKYILQHNV